MVAQSWHLLHPGRACSHQGAFLASHLGTGGHLSFRMRVGEAYYPGGRLGCFAVRGKSWTGTELGKSWKL